MKSAGRFGLKALKRRKTMSDAVIVEAVRSPGGRYRRGGLAATRGDEIGIQVMKGLLARVPKLKPEDVDDVIVGCSFPEAEQGMNLGRIIALGAGGGFAIDADLREIDFGRWEGMSFTEIAAADPAAVERWAALEENFAFPGGESIRNFRERIRAAADRIAADSAQDVVAITHGGVIRLLICLFLGLDVRHTLLFEVRPASITELSLDDGKGVLKRVNDTHHLEDY